MSQVHQLIANGTATGSVARWQGGKGTYLVNGTFSGATITLQYQSIDTTTWIDVGTEAALTADGVVAFELAAGPIRAAVVGGPPSGIYATAIANAGA